MTTTTAQLAEAAGTRRPDWRAILVLCVVALLFTALTVVSAMHELHPLMATFSILPPVGVGLFYLLGPPPPPGKHLVVLFLGFVALQTMGYLVVTGPSLEAKRVEIARILDNADPLVADAFKKWRALTFASLPSSKTEGEVIEWRGDNSQLLLIAPLSSDYAPGGRTWTTLARSESGRLFELEFMAMGRPLVVQPVGEARFLSNADALRKLLALDRPDLIEKIGLVRRPA